MSGRSRGAWRLAGGLAAAAGVPVRVEWHGRASGRYGGWHATWVDGPTVEQMRALVASVSVTGSPEVRAFDRGSTDLGETAALLAHLAARPELAAYVSGGLVHEAHNQVAHPDRGDVATLERARALLGAFGGMCGLPAVDAIRQRAQTGGWPAVERWLDQLVAAAADPAVAQLAARRAARLAGSRP